VFVDAGITAIDLERKRKKEEMKAKETQAKSVAEHGELALITVDQPAQLKPPERIPLRPPMLQVWTYSFLIIGERQKVILTSLRGQMIY
jgi:hypothetical protein